VTVAVVNVFDEPCHLIGLVPSDFVARIGQDDEAAGHGDAVRDALGATLRDVPLRVWAEVGRARLRSAEVASLGDGAIVELDRAAEDPVDLYVNGSRIATGRLVCIDGKEWAVRLEEVFASAEADPAA
jgi:flagellar motor switch protein FliN/FliY